MEKIQSALAKARAERSTKESRATPVTRPAAATTPVPSGDVAKAWQSLPTLDLDQKHLKRNRIIALEGGGEATDIDMMRTRVLQQMRDNGWRRRGKQLWPRIRFCGTRELYVLY